MKIGEENLLSRILVPVGILRQAAGKKVALLALCAGSTLSIDSALADSVNGEWCSSDGREIEILFEEVKLSDGTEAHGEYDRHHYVFRIPTNGEQGGATVDLVLADRDIAYVRYYSEAGLELSSEPEKWTRCELGVS